MPKELRNAYTLFLQGKLGEALEILKELEKNQALSSKDRLFLLILKGYVYSASLNFKECVKAGDLAYPLSLKLQDNVSAFEALALKSFIFLLGDFKSANEHILESERILNSLMEKSTRNVLRHKISLAYRKSWFLYFKGKIDKS